MGELSAFITRPAGAYPTCVSKIHNPGTRYHGRFYFVGSIPGECYDFARNNGRGGSKIYDTEQAALDAAVNAGATRIQKVDCTFYRGK